MESTPVVFKGSLLLMESLRPHQGNAPEDCFVHIIDLETNKVVATGIAKGYTLASVFVDRDAFYCFATDSLLCERKGITVFKSRDLVNWTSKKVIKAEEGERLFNTSVCRAEGRFVLAYETDEPTYVPFSIKFAESEDMENWRKIPGIVFGKDRYTACPTIRYVNGYFYMLYLEYTNKPGSIYETYLTRSKNLIDWESSQLNPVIAPNSDGSENNNTSDADLVEYDGKTYVFYFFCEQDVIGSKPWGLTCAIFDGSMAEFFESYYPFH